MAKVERQKALLTALNDTTPLAVVLQQVVAKYLTRPTRLLVAEMGNHVISGVSLKDSTIETIVGQRGMKGFTDGASALLASPSGIVLDNFGVMYVTERNGVRRVANDITSTVWISQMLPPTSCCALHGRTLYFSCNHCIYYASLDGEFSPEVFAGVPAKGGFADGKNAEFLSPKGLAVDSKGNLFVADSGNHRIRMISAEGVTTTLAGCGTSDHRDGPAEKACFKNPFDVAEDGRGNLLVADFFNRCVRSVGVRSGVVTTIAGCHKDGRTQYKDGHPLFPYPTSIVVDSETQIAFVGTLNSIRRLDLETREVSVVCENMKLCKSLAFA